MGWWIAAFSLLLIAEKPRHGYEIASELRKVGIPIFGIGQMGSIYRTLASLEAMGMIFPTWDTSVSPPRKVYKVTPIGIEYLKEIEEEVKAIKTMADNFLERMGELKDEGK